MDPRIREIEKSYLRNDLPAFAPGDTVRVRVRVREGQKERVQPFEGICIARRGGGVNETFTLRRVSGGVGVERIFPLNSPAIAGLEVVRRGDVRRAKLYYLRQRSGKRARVRERRWWLDKTRFETEQAAAALAAAEAGEIEVAPEVSDEDDDAEQPAAAEEDTVQAEAAMPREASVEAAATPPADREAALVTPDGEAVQGEAEPRSD